MLKLQSGSIVLGASIVATAGLIGCGGQDAAPPAESGKVSEAWKQGLDKKQVAGLSELSTADREAALAQKVCPVSDMALGSMGKPLTVTVEGRDVFLCCESCEEQIKSDPAKYLAKLDEKQ